MLRRTLVLAVCLAFSMDSSHADELTKSVQGALKQQGFYYGEVSGASGPETAAAVKRYQIRNGLEVTGTLTKETLEALGLADNQPASIPIEPPRQTVPLERAPEPLRPLDPPRPAASPAPRPPDLRRDTTTQEQDREFLRREQAAPTIEDEEPPFQRGPSQFAAGPYGRTFAQTPYATAPVEVQRDVVKRAQRFLENLNFYDEAIDGVPGPAFEEGVLGYQRFIDLPLTGQLDLETLAAMRLLPGRGGSPAQSANPQVRRVPGGALRGVWIK